MGSNDSGLMLLKPKRKKKQKKHKESITDTEKGICFLCALEGDRSYKITEDHHVLFGSGQRETSEKEGLKVYLCIPHHRTGKKAVHNCRETREKLCRILQAEYEKTHTRAEWMAAFKKNYL